MKIPPHLRHLCVAVVRGQMQRRTAKDVAVFGLGVPDPKLPRRGDRSKGEGH